MNWKGFGRKRSWPNFKVPSQYSPASTEENIEKLQITTAGRRDRKSNTGPPGHEAGVLTTRPRRSVLLVLKAILETKIVFKSSA
jgi:hypothetical protein